MFWRSKKQSSYDRTRESAFHAMFMLEACQPRDFAEKFEEARAAFVPPPVDAVGTPVEPLSITATPLTFEGGQPSVLFPEGNAVVYRGQEATKARITLHVDTLGLNERFKALFTGPAGTGKTTLARITAARIQQRHRALRLPVGNYYEILPAQVETKAQLDVFMRQIAAEPLAIVFIDEVHMLQNVESLFHVLHDTGSLRYPLDNGQWLDIPTSISWLAATTDPGLLDTTTGGAMRRRLQPELRLDAPDEDTLTAIVQDLAKTARLSVDEAAAREIAARSIFPWQALLIFKETRLVAVRDRHSHIGLGDVLLACDIIQIDERGLLREDRDVMAALLRAPHRLASGVIRYKMGEEALAAAAGVDRATYKRRVQPKLIRLGLLTTTGGQCLTDRALTLYGTLAM